MERAAADRLLRAGAFAAFSLTAVPAAHAQFAGRLSVESEYRLRGYAIAEAEPVVTTSATYDDSSGVYANGLVIAGAGRSDFDVIGFQAGAGYAARVGQSLSVDAGMMHTQYARRVGGRLDLHYTELYAGLSSRNVTARVYYSPNYFGGNRHTLYGEIEGNVQPLTHWNVNLHLGALAYLNALPAGTDRARYDWRATISRNAGRFELYASLSGRGPGGDRYATTKGRAVVTAGAAVAF